MLIRIDAGKDGTRACIETEGSDKAGKNQRIAQENNRRPDGVEGMFVQISHAETCLTWVKAIET